MNRALRFLLWLIRRRPYHWEPEKYARFEQGERRLRRRIRLIEAEFDAWLGSDQ